MTQSIRLRIALIALAIAALLGAMWGGLLRIGWPWPLLDPPLPMSHGPLMVGGFLGTLISLERAVALNRRWAYVAPLSTGLGALLLMLGVPSWLGPLLITLGSFVLVFIFAAIVRQQPALFTATMSLGAAIWSIGNALWLAGRPIPSIVLWWMGFLVITIVGERLELSRLLRLTAWRYATFFTAIGLFAVGIAVSAVAFDAGVRLSGVGMIGLAAWLARYDLARRTVRKNGLTRYIALSLLAGYVWLSVSGLLALIYGGVLAGSRYDAILHGVFVGFVISMIFGHAPIIFPAVLRFPVGYDRSFYLHLGLLHLSLLLRIGGDLGSWFELRRFGGLLNAVAILLFLANTIRTARTVKRKQRSLPRDARLAPEGIGSASNPRD